MKNGSLFSNVPYRRIGIALIVLAVLLMGFGQPALASVNDTYRSWSYYTDRSGNTTLDDHYWSDEISWQGSSSVAYDDANYAKSLIGFDNYGNLEAKIGVSVNNSINRVYSASYYRDDGFQGNGGTAVPLGGGFEMQLKQDGRFTVGSPNYSLNYYMRTPSTAYSFHFAVQQGEVDLEPYGWFSKESLITGESTTVDMAIAPEFFELLWEDTNDDGVYNFSYDFSFGGCYTNGIDFVEELSVSSYAYASGFENQFFDSYNSFYAKVNPAEGASFYRGDQFVVGPQAVPEPASMLLFGSGLAGIFLRKKFIRK